MQQPPAAVERADQQHQRRQHRHRNPEQHGVHSAEDVSDRSFDVPEKSPLVAILNAESDQPVGVAYDPEDGLLPAANLSWTSDRDGFLEPGRQVKLERLSLGNHVLTLTVTDSQGRTVTAQVTKRVQRTPDKQDR